MPGGNAFLAVGPGSLIADRYEIVSRIAAGGMGVVFRALDRQLGATPIALKILHPHLSHDQSVLKRFINEVLVARTLTQPNIVRIHDIGTTAEGMSYISMELVEGCSLADVIAKIHGTGLGVSRLSPDHFRQIVALYHQVVVGISYAHTRGIVHRDLKPANILVNRDGEVKIGDFGTARLVNIASTITSDKNSAVGTPHYMSPEQIRGEPVDATADIYALGIIAYELATGVRPFESDSMLAIAYKHINEGLPDFAGADTGIPDWYGKMAQKAAAKEKKDRFQAGIQIAELIMANYGAVSEFQPNTIQLDFSSLRNREPPAMQPITSANPPLIRTGQADNKAGIFTRIMLGGMLLSLMAIAAALFVLIRSPAMRPAAVVPAPPAAAAPAVTEAPAQQTVAAPEATAPAVSDLAMRPTMPPPRESELGSESQKPAAQAARPTTRPQAVAPQSDSGIVRLRYAGRLSVPLSGDTSQPERQIKMELKISGSTIAGAANIKGLGILEVRGQKLPSGYELDLRNEQIGMRLTGVQRMDVLRGTFYIPLTNTRGAWQVAEE